MQQGQETDVMEQDTTQLQLPETSGVEKVLDTVEKALEHVAEAAMGGDEPGASTGAVEKHDETQPLLSPSTHASPVKSVKGVVRDLFSAKKRHSVPEGLGGLGSNDTDLSNQNDIEGVRSNDSLPGTPSKSRRGSAISYVPDLTGVTFSRLVDGIYKKHLELINGLDAPAEDKEFQTNLLALSILQALKVLKMKDKKAELKGQVIEGHDDIKEAALQRATDINNNVFILPAHKTSSAATKVIDGLTKDANKALVDYFTHHLELPGNEHPHKATKDIKYKNVTRLGIVEAIIEAARTQVTEQTNNISTTQNQAIPFTIEADDKGHVTLRAENQEVLVTTEHSVLGDVIASFVTEDEKVYVIQQGEDGKHFVWDTASSPEQVLTSISANIKSNPKNNEKVVYQKVEKDGYKDPETEFRFYQEENDLYFKVLYCGTERTGKVDFADGKNALKVRGHSNVMYFEKGVLYTKNNDTNPSQVTVINPLKVRVQGDFLNKMDIVVEQITLALSQEITTEPSTPTKEVTQDPSAVNDATTTEPGKDAVSESEPEQPAAEPTAGDDNVQQPTPVDTTVVNNDDKTTKGETPATPKTPGETPSTPAAQVDVKAGIDKIMDLIVGIGKAPDAKEDDKKSTFVARVIAAKDVDISKLQAEISGGLASKIMSEINTNKDSAFAKKMQDLAEKGSDSAEAKQFASMVMQAFAQIDFKGSAKFSYVGYRNNGGVANLAKSVMECLYGIIMYTLDKGESFKKWYNSETSAKVLDAQKFEDALNQDVKVKVKTEAEEKDVDTKPLDLVLQKLVARENKAASIAG